MALKSTLYGFQRTGVNLLDAFDGRALLADDMGLGKSIQTLAYLDRHPEFRRTLVVCPAYLKWHWEKEAKLHIGLQAEILSSTKPPRRQHLLPSSRLLIINYEILQYWVRWLQRLKLDLIVGDEIQYIKGRTTARSVAFQALCIGLPSEGIAPIPHVLGISGTPIENKPAEIWPFMHAMRPNDYKAFTAFGKKFCGARRAPWGMTYDGATRIKELNRQLRRHGMIRRRKSQVLKDLPPKQRSVVPLDIRKRRAYNAAVNDFVNWLRHNDPKALRGALRAKGLAQVGYLKRLAARLKLKAACEWIDDFLASGSKLVVFAIHKKIVAKLRERYAGQCVVVTGDTPTNKRKFAFEKFNTNAKCRLFIGNLDAAGTGWSARADTVAFVELGWVPGKHTQAEDRCHGLKRGVAGRRTRCVYLVGRGTIEEKLAMMLQRKQKVLDGVLDGGQVDDTLNLYDELVRALRAK